MPTATILDSDAAPGAAPPLNAMHWLDRTLDAISRVSGALGGIALLATALLVAAQVVARMLGTQIPAADDFAAWSMAATVFLSLPYTLRQGAHIRVTLALQVLPPRAKQLCEVLSTVAALVLVGWAAKHCTLFVHESFVGNELSQGMVILPMWIPQLSMPIGMWGMFVMLLGRLVCALRGDYWTEEGHG